MSQKKDVHFAPGINPVKESYTIKDFTPLIIVALAVTIFSFAMMQFADGGMHTFMQMFMAAFFLIFGGLKLLKLSHFAMAYSKYDLIAKHSKSYALVYPFIEIALGIGYLVNFSPYIVNGITFVLMTIGALGVLRVLMRGEKIECACMGAVFKIPMTGVTLGENVLMAGMALMMLM